MSRRTGRNKKSRRTLVPKTLERVQGPDGLNSHERPEGLKATQRPDHFLSFKHLIESSVTSSPGRNSSGLDLSPGQGVAVGVTVREEENEETHVMKSRLTGRGKGEFLLLGEDEWHAGAVRAQGRGLLAAAAVKHGQRGQWWSYAAVPGHVPQLLTVPLDGVVVVQLNPGHTVVVDFKKVLV